MAGRYDAASAGHGVAMSGELGSFGADVALEGVLGAEVVP